MAEVISKGMFALQRHGNRPVSITVGGETFYFRKLTISAEEAIKSIIKQHQDSTLKEPVKPDDDATEEQLKEYFDAYESYQERTNTQFRKLTCALMKYILVDEVNKPFFDEGDEIYDIVNNVYIETFYKAYTMYRDGTDGSVVEAEKRFQK